MFCKRKTFEQYFQGFLSQFGRFLGNVRLSVAENAVNVELPACGVPVTSRKALRCGFARLVQLKVVVAVDEPTKWISEIVVVKINLKSFVRI